MLPVLSGVTCAVEGVVGCRVLPVLLRVLLGVTCFAEGVVGVTCAVKGVVGWLPVLLRVLSGGTKGMAGLWKSVLSSRLR